MDAFEDIFTLKGKIYSIKANISKEIINGTVEWIGDNLEDSS